MSMVSCDPQRPYCRPFPQHAPLRVGPGRLRESAALMLEQLTTDELRDLHSWVGASGRSWTMGTACSGTDAPMLAWSALAAAIQDKLGVVLGAAQRFACECDSAKREFLQVVCGAGVPVFLNTCELASPSATVHSGPPQEAPPVHVLIAGFPCTAASALNQKSASDENRSCISSSSLATGSVFADLVAYVAKHYHGVHLLILENVPPLARRPNGGGRSNLQEVAAQLWNKLGMLLKVFLLDPRLFGTPQSRGRLWMVGYRPHGEDGAAIARRMANVMDRLTGLVPINAVHEFLLADDDPAWLASARRSAAKHAEAMGDRLGAALHTSGIANTPLQKRRRIAPLKWQGEHSQRFFDAGLSPNDIPKFDWQLLLEFPGLAQLSKREVEVLFLSGVRCFPEESPRFIELTMSISRCMVRADCVSAVTPKYRQFLTRQCRLVHAYESFALQGLEFERRILERFDCALLQSLAGNAFETGCCLATMVSSLVSMSYGAWQRSHASLEVSLGPPAELDASDSECESTGAFGA